jgi:heme-degrading monooxygenase HmoA
MILEVAILEVRPGQASRFERDFVEASRLISAAKGYLSHELQRCLETPNQYALLVRWETLADHTGGFRKSPAYAEWKSLLHHYYDPFPTVEHYAQVFAQSRDKQLSQ